MEPRKVAAWEATRARGRTRFVLLHGTIWAVLTSLLLTIVDLLAGRFTWGGAGLGLVIFALLGPLYGVLVWTIAERRYRRHVLEPRGR